MNRKTILLIINETLEKGQSSSKNPRHWKIDTKIRNEFIEIILELIKSEKMEYFKMLEKVGLIRLKGLSEREKMILRERFLQSNTLEHVAKEKGITRERIRQIENRALAKLNSAKTYIDSLIDRRVYRENERKQARILKNWRKYKTKIAVGSFLKAMKKIECMGEINVDLL